MKTISITEAESNLPALLKAAQKEHVVLTQAGRPSVVLVGVQSYDEEDLQLASSMEFWQMIQARRKGRSIPLAELKARLKATSSRVAKRAAARRTPKNRK